MRGRLEKNAPRLPRSAAVVLDVACSLSSPAPPGASAPLPLPGHADVTVMACPTPGQGTGIARPACPGRRSREKAATRGQRRRRAGAEKKEEPGTCTLRAPTLYIAAVLEEGECVNTDSAPAHLGVVWDVDARGRRRREKKRRMSTEQRRLACPPIHFSRAVEKKKCPAYWPCWRAWRCRPLPAAPPRHAVSPPATPTYTRLPPSSARA